MKKFLISSFGVLFAAGGFSLYSQEKADFTPYFKPIVLVFSNVNTTFNSIGTNRAFELTRAYLGFEYFFSKTLSSRVNLDVADPGVGKLQMTAYMKNAYFLYKKDGFSVRVGMIGTDIFSTQEKVWGYRYILKSFQDAYNFGPSADLGAAIEYTPVPFLTIDASLLNGEGYKNLQADSTFKETIGLTLRPLNGLILRAYYDVINHTFNQSSLAFFAGYSSPKFRAGLEYNSQKNNQLKEGHDFSGISVYSAFVISERFSVFGRYDNLRSRTVPGTDDPWNYGKDGRLFMGGFDYSPVKGLKIAPTYSGWSPRNSISPFTSTLALNFEIRF